MDRLIRGILCALALWANSVQAQISAEEFTNEAAAALRKALPGIRVTVRQELQLEVIDTIGIKGFANLDNFYAEYLHAPDSLPAVLARIVATHPSARVLAPELDTLKLYPILRPRELLEESAATLKVSAGDLDLIIEDYNDELIVLFVLDTPEHYVYITNASATRAGLDCEGVRRIAMANLHKCVAQLDYDAGSLLTSITVEGDLEPSMLLRDDLWTDRPLQVKGEIVAAVPNRNVLLIAGSKSPGGVDNLRERTRMSFLNAGYPLSQVLFVFRKGRFVRFEE
jgi:uncharacterized protein YtpQ (UPF0354 family)